MSLLRLNLNVGSPGVVYLWPPTRLLEPWTERNGNVERERRADACVQPSDTSTGPPPAPRGFTKPAALSSLLLPAPVPLQVHAPVQAASSASHDAAGGDLAAPAHKFLQVLHRGKWVSLFTPPFLPFRGKNVAPTVVAWRCCAFPSWANRVSHVYEIWSPGNSIFAPRWLASCNGTRFFSDVRNVTIGDVRLTPDNCCYTMKYVRAA